MIDIRWIAAFLSAIAASYLARIAFSASVGCSPRLIRHAFAAAGSRGLEVETMIAAQMAAIHVATMTFACRLNHVENIPQQDSAERALNKLARTFTTQMEALNRHRGKGQQKVTVEHVHVHEGGQAIVGHVERRGDLSKPEVGVTTQKPRMSEPTQ
ncbi:MAG: hypothetical protein ABSA62_11420 [Methyloceanibacter sp.]